MDGTFLSNALGEKEGSLVGVRTQDGIDIYFTESRFSALVDGKICVPLKNQSAPKLLSQTSRFYSMNDGGEEAKKSMIGFFFFFFFTNFFF